MSFNLPNNMSVFVYISKYSMKSKSIKEILLRFTKLLSWIVICLTSSYTFIDEPREYLASTLKTIYVSISPISFNWLNFTST